MKTDNFMYQPIQVLKSKITDPFLEQTTEKKVHISMKQIVHQKFQVLQTKLNRPIFKE